MTKYFQVVGKLSLLGTLSAMALVAPVFGQTTESGTAALEEVVITGSLITTNGYQAPTPVTVATAETLQESSPTSIDVGLEKLPQFLGSTGPQTVGFGQTVQGDVLNLRGLGPNRTLILLDGVRVPPTSYLNTVDVDVLPQLLVQRVDIVTGGASATYGSDAVAGVVNYVLDTNFTGVKGEVQQGISTRGDDQNQRYGLAGGTAVGDHGHFIGSVEYSNSAGFDIGARPILGSGGGVVGSVVGSKFGAGTVQNPDVNAFNIHFNYATYGGVAQSGPFNNTNFVSSGLYAPVNMGTATGTTTSFIGPNDYYQFPLTDAAQAALRNLNSFARFSYDFGANTTAYAQVIASQSHTSARIEDNFMALPGFTIFGGNAFLPAPLQAQLTSTSTPQFTMSAQYNYLGPITETQNVNNYEEQVGIKGKLGRFNWALDDAFGSVIDAVKAYNEINFQNFYAAVDAVVNPANGAIVCRPLLSTTPSVVAQYTGCQPFNPFGVGAASPAAAAYVLGTSQYDVTTSENNIQGSIGGDLFPLPAGPLSAAVGFDFRSQKMQVASNANPGTPYNTTGLRGTSVLTQYYLINQSNASGSENVKEAYGEVEAPLLKDLPLVKSLDVNAGVRYTDYSISGSATTWKVGGTWRVYNDLMFRATQSRDIRAPTLYDLYAGEQVAPASVNDPHTGISSGAPQVTSGNPNLTSELGSTFTGGFVYQPSYLQGFALSLDYYRIGMSGAIATLSALAADQACEATNGTGSACANIIRPHPFSDHSSDNFPTEFIVSGVNIASLYTDGFDLDASYSTRLFGGNFTTRAYATYINEFSTQLTTNQPLINYAGWNAGGSGGVSAAIPRFKGALSLNYAINDYRLFIQENMIGNLRLGPILQYLNDYVPAYYSTDLTFTYLGVPKVWGADVQFFVSVTNLFDKTPPVVAGSTVTSLYDTVGRMFVAGVRFNLK